MPCAQSPTDWILSIYGMPVWVQDGQRKRSLDQLLALCLEEPPIGDQLVLSPLYYRDAPSDRVVIPVSRLDAPTIGQARHDLGVLGPTQKLGRLSPSLPLR